MRDAAVVAAGCACHVDGALTIQRALRAANKDECETGAARVNVTLMSTRAPFADDHLSANAVESQ